MVVGERPVVDDADTGEHRERAPHLPLAQRLRKNQNEHCGGEDHRTDEPRPHRTQEQSDRGEAQRGVEVRVVGGGDPASRSWTPAVTSGAPDVTGSVRVDGQARRARHEAPFIPVVSVPRARAARHR